MVLGIITGGLLHWSPIIKPLPQPTGPYDIGITSMYLVDQLRNESYSVQDKQRSLVTHIWYPSSTQGKERCDYLGSKMPFFQKLFASFFSIPQWISSLLWRNVITHTYSDVPIASSVSRYPVILFSHGLGGMPSDSYMTIVENIVSYGYIVIGIDHPYFNLITRYSDGKIISSTELTSQFQHMNVQEQYAFQSKAIDVYIDDMRFVIDQVALLNNNENSMFYNRFDCNKIGVMGHSAGGTAAIECCRRDKRCKVAIDLDGWYDHVIGNEPIEQPLLLMFGSKSLKVSEPTVDYLAKKEMSREQYYARACNRADHRERLCKSATCEMVIIPHASHGDFGDEILLKWPLRGWRDVEAYTTLSTINGYILKFLAIYLKESRLNG